MLFHWLEYWLAADHTNFILFIGFFTALTFLAIGLMGWVVKKTQAANEKDTLIKVSIHKGIVYALLCLLTIFILAVPENAFYVRQYIVMIISLSLTAGAVTGIFQYSKLGKSKHIN